LVLLLIGIEMGQLLTALDQTVVGTAAPRILAGTFLIAIGFFATLFLREIPLRKSHRGKPEA
jgi:hypothetical protein